LEREKFITNKQVSSEFQLMGPLGELTEIAKRQKYPNGKPAEGIVIRPIENVFSEILMKRLSFKVLNPEYKD